MKRYTKERLFEVMQRVDETFKPNLNENVNTITDRVADDIIKLIFTPEELQLLEKSHNQDTTDWNDASEHDNYAGRENYELKETMLNIFKNKNVQISDETMNFLVFELFNYFL